jgi:hypothetical protein
MTRQDYLLICLMEECAEVAQRASKAIRFGIDGVQEGNPLNNSERIMVEYCDFIAVVEMLQDEGAIARIKTRREIEKKKRKVEKYMSLKNLKV